MKNGSFNLKRQKFFIHIRSSLWFVPSLIILGAILLAVTLTEIDLRLDHPLRAWWPRLFGIGADGARAMLSAIATSMATVAGVVFSITMVVLTLASTQYTTRVLRNFMRDRLTQVVLGVFVGVYLYCLLVLRTVSGGDDEFVPSVAILGGIALAIIATGFFIYFIHHISSSIQASKIVSDITKETLDVLDHLFPQDVGDEADEVTAAAADAHADWHCVPSTQMGYIATVDSEALLDFARQHRTLLRMECGIGEFTAPGRTLLYMAADRPPDKETIEALNAIYAVASYRTIDQDAAFGIRQLVDISLKALSPSINDSTTASTCIEHLSVLLAYCAPRRMAGAYRSDDAGFLLIAKGPTFDYLVSLAFSQILENAEGNLEIMIQLLTAIDHIARVARTRSRLEVLRKWADAIDETAHRTLKASHARRRLAEKMASVRAILEANRLPQVPRCQAAGSG